MISIYKPSLSASSNNAQKALSTLIKKISKCAKEDLTFDLKISDNNLLFISFNYVQVCDF